MVERITTQPTYETERGTHRVAQPLSPAAVPAQSHAEAGFNIYGRPVPVDEFLKQLQDDNHKRMMRAWRLASRFGLTISDAFTLLERQDGALVADRVTASAIVPLLAEKFEQAKDEVFWHRFNKHSPPDNALSSFWILPSVPALRAPTFCCPLAWRVVGNL